MRRKIAYHPFSIRLLNWEYWPFHLIYGPIYLYWIWLCIRARSLFFFNNSNPSIENGGFLMESKWNIYKLIPGNYHPRTLFFTCHTSPTEVIAEIRKENFRYPLIGKPDIGMKGLAVKKLNTEHDLVNYILSSPVHFLVQEFVPYENEVGVFYYRYPNESRGHISGVVNKQFLAVKGDGESTILELLQRDKRHILQLPALRSGYGQQLYEVLEKDEEFILVPYGSHTRGAKFVDESHQIDEQLTQTIDSICRQVNGFYYGRLDIRFNTWEELKEGKNFSIIEINGAGSEPTHMYDPKHSILFAWKEIFRHWTILYRISRMNYKKTERPYMNLRSGLKMLRDSSRYIRMLKA